MAPLAYKRLVFASPLAINVPADVPNQFTHHDSLASLPTYSLPHCGPSLHTKAATEVRVLPFLQKPKLLLSPLTIMAAIASPGDLTLPMRKVKHVFRTQGYPTAVIVNAVG